MASLYQIEGREMRLMELLEIEGLTDDESAELCAAFEELAGDKENFADRCTMVFRNKAADVAAIDTEIDRLNGLRKAAEGSANRLKKRIAEYMERTGQKHLDGHIGKFTLRAGSASVDVQDTSIIPAEYWRVVPETRAVDKNAIKEAIRAGAEVPGARIVIGAPSLLMK